MRRNFLNQLHLADVHIVARAGQQGFQHEGFSVSALQLAIAIDAHIALAVFRSVRRHVEEVLRIGHAGRRMILAFGQASAA